MRALLTLCNVPIVFAAQGMFKFSGLCKPSEWQHIVAALSTDQARQLLSNISVDRNQAGSILGDEVFKLVKQIPGRVQQILDCPQFVRLHDGTRYRAKANGVQYRIQGEQADSTRKNIHADDTQNTHVYDFRVAVRFPAAGHPSVISMVRRQRARAVRDGAFPDYCIPIPPGQVRPTLAHLICARHGLLWTVINGSMLLLTPLQGYSMDRHVGTKYPTLNKNDEGDWQHWTENFVGLTVLMDYYAV
jgi:hypothetical protein